MNELVEIGLTSYNAAFITFVMLQLREDKKSPIYSRPMKQVFVFVFDHDCNMTSGQRQKVQSSYNAR